jgi:NAD(P)-dependent dehydrogenase (short-subunit alcohol dehydrogenase family)
MDKSKIGSFDLTGKTSLITGAAGGIGYAIAELFALKGSDLILFDISDSLKEKAEELKKTGVRVAAYNVDLCDDKALAAAVDDAHEKMGLINILVNCAGIGPLAKAEEYPRELWNKTMAVNLNAPFVLSQLVARKLITASKPGKIINLASQAGIVAIEGHTAYTTSKHALIGLTKSMAFEWGKYGINVNAISPTVIWTDLAAGYWTGKVAEKALGMIPLNRFGRPDEVAAAALYLASSESDLVTGSNLVIDGGYTIN